MIRLNEGRSKQWTLPESNRRPPPCKGGALPIELRARAAAEVSDFARLFPDRLVELAGTLALEQRSGSSGEQGEDGKLAHFDASLPTPWAIEDLNLGPRPYQGRALTA